MAAVVGVPPVYNWVIIVDDEVDVVCTTCEEYYSQIAWLIAEDISYSVAIVLQPYADDFLDEVASGEPWIEQAKKFSQP